jgi:hypothetical protein
VRGSGYRVRVWRGAAPRRASDSALLRIGPQGPSARVLATSASRRRRKGSSAARSPLQGPLGPPARRSPLQLQARGGFGRGAPQTSRGSAPARSMPGAALPRPARLSAWPLSHGSSGRALRPSPAPLSPSRRRRRSSPRSTFPRFLRPARPPPPRPRLLTLPPSPPPRPAPAARACRPPPKCYTRTSSDPLGPPGEVRCPAGRSGHEYFSSGETALCRCHGTGCCGNSTNPPKGQGRGPRKRPQVRAGGLDCRQRPSREARSGVRAPRQLPAGSMPPAGQARKRSWEAGREGARPR